MGERGWIGGRGWDLALIFGGAPVALGCGAIALARPDLIVPLWLIWLTLVDGPHLVATVTRVWKVRRRLLLGSLVWLAPGFLALGASELSGSSGPWEAFLLFALLWSVHHNTRQHYGILSLYLRHARATPAARRRDVWFLYGTAWGMLGIFSLQHMTSVPTGALLALTGAAFAVYAAWALRDIARGADWRPAAYTLIPASGISAFGYFVVGARPLVTGAPDLEGAFLAVAFVGGTVHGMQYLGIVFAANRRRDGDYHAWLVYAALVAASLVYLVLNMARGILAPGWALVPPGLLARVWLALYWGVFFHHYYVDQKIWRPHADPALRRELGLA